MKIFQGILVSLLVLAVYSLSQTLSLKLTVPESKIIFSHRLHVEEQEVECSACHISIAESTNSSDKNLPTMDECSACHDVEDETTCSMCHKEGEDFEELINPDREIIFNHALHLGMAVACERCHGEIVKSEKPDEKLMPSMATCFTCHDNIKADRECNLCHSGNISIADIHPIGWENDHGEHASMKNLICSDCHAMESFCVDCHRGDNKTGTIHDLNYFFTHGLDAKSNQKDCQHCHETKSFCVACHEQGMRMPLNHSRLNWLTDHSQAAKADVENCAACHDASDLTCARAGCHSDFDGVIGTDPTIHSPNSSVFDSEGAWHGDDSYFCFQCHKSSRNLPSGFCGYCHENNKD